MIKPKKGGFRAFFSWKKGILELVETTDVPNGRRQIGNIWVNDFLFKFLVRYQVQTSKKNTFFE
jgi:hypothetical protein